LSASLQFRRGKKPCLRASSSHARPNRTPDRTADGADGLREKVVAQRHHAAQLTARSNAAMESFFGTLKAEFFHLAKIDDITQLEAGVHDYIRYYNHERIKLGLQGLSPVTYRLRNTA
jgi:transposase InsO family protein